MCLDYATEGKYTIKQWKKKLSEKMGFEKFLKS